LNVPSRILVPVGSLTVLLVVLFAPARTRVDPSAEASAQGIEAAGRHDYGLAISYFTDAIRLRPGWADAYSNRALAEAYKGDFAGAVADCDEAVRLDPGSASSYNARGNLKKAMGDIDGAIADFGDAIRAEPGLAKSYFNRGNAKRAKGDLRGCMADYDEAIRLDPRDAGAYNNRGGARQILHDYEGAIADFSTAVRLDPGHDKSYDGLAWVLATCPVDRIRDGKKAVELATKACELAHWKNPRYIGTLAAAYAEGGDFDKALGWEARSFDFKLPEEDVAEARQRMILYQQRLPYRDQGD
jgi:tetratricopeptide (TPR) repeat protein